MQKLEWADSTSHLSQEIFGHSTPATLLQRHSQERVCARGDSNGAPPSLTVTRVSGLDCGQAAASAVRPHFTMCQRSATFEDTRWLERRVLPHDLTEAPSIRHAPFRDNCSSNLA